jgi:hypothetical protein
MSRRPSSRCVVVLAVVTCALGSTARPIGATERVVQRSEPRPTPAAPAAPDPFSAAQAGIDWLLPAMCAWMQDPAHMDTDCTDGRLKTCLGCHVQGEGTLALARSASRCYALPANACALPQDESVLEFTTRFVAGTQRKACIIGPFQCNGARQDPTTTDGRFQNLGSIGLYGDCGAKQRRLDIPMAQSAHGGLALGGYSTFVSPAYSGNLLALADWFVTVQQPAGHWILDHANSPVSQGDAFMTGAAAWTLADARMFGLPAQVAAYDAAIARAVTWVRTATLTTNQDKVFALLTLVHGGIAAPDVDFVRVRDDLMDDVHADGGWAERPGLQSNAYATGQAVFALDEAGVSLSQPATCGGIQWLVANQEGSGAWSLGVRGTSTDSQSGSAFTATSWPVLALGSLSRFGVEIVERPALVVTCDPETTFQLTVRNVADNPCGLFPRTDALMLDVVNASGDTVTVDPPTLALDVGAEGTVTVTWQRVATGPGETSLTTLTASSSGAAALGCPVLDTRDLEVRVPSPAMPFGVALAPDVPPVASCDADRSWVVTVTNTAETPCGNLPSTDVIDLGATNDLGDLVDVSPASVTLLSGESTDVSLSWTRVGGPRAPDIVSTTTLRAVSTGAAAAGETVEATVLREIHPPEPVRSYGIVLDPEEIQSVGCEQTLAWVVTLTNTADDPCGALPRNDDYELSVLNDAGDTATVDPAVMSLSTGQSGVATVTWQRSAAPPPPGTPSTTTLLVVSAGARAAGESVEATAVFGQSVPPPDPPWAIRVAPLADAVVTCDPTWTWPVTVRNLADDSCGLFPVADTIELSAVNDSGDAVQVLPATVRLLPGEQAVVDLSWTRAAGPHDPAITSMTTLVATSVGARDAGSTVEATAMFGQSVPPPDPPWAIQVAPPIDGLITCDPTWTWPVTVRNLADDSCGLWSVADTIELSAANDSGDAVQVLPATITLLPGEESVVDLSWTRTGGPRDPGITSTTTLVATSVGARDAGGSVVVQASRAVTSPDDPVPGPATPGLRVSRNGDDLTLRWDPHPDAIGGYEIVSVECLARGACAEHPTHGVLDARAPIASLPSAQLQQMLAGAAAPGMPPLVFYKVRGTSPCRLLPGPTCAFACSDPDRCDAQCP